MNRLAAIFLILLVAVVGAKWLWKQAPYPPVPEAWRADFSGMYYDDARALLGEPDYSFGAYLRNGDGTGHVLDTMLRAGMQHAGYTGLRVVNQFIDDNLPIGFYDVWIISSDIVNGSRWYRLLVLEYCGGGPDGTAASRTRSTVLERRDLSPADLVWNRLGRGIKLC